MQKMQLTKKRPGFPERFYFLLFLAAFTYFAARDDKIV